MKNGFLVVDSDGITNERKLARQKKKNKTIKNTIIAVVVGFCVLIGGITLAVYIGDVNYKKFESYFGGYDTAEEYVSHLARVNYLRLEDSSYINSYGVSIEIENLSDKIVKNIKVKYRVYNSLGEWVNSDFDGKVFSYSLGVTGARRQTSTKIYDTDEPVSTIKIVSFKIEYKDGSVVKFNSKMLECL